MVLSFLAPPPTFQKSPICRQALTQRDSLELLPLWSPGPQALPPLSQYVTPGDTGGVRETQGSHSEEGSMATHVKDAFGIEAPGQAGFPSAWH